MNREKIKLQKEKETLLIPLYCKYLESQKESPIIEDKKAAQIIRGVEYDYEQLTIPRQTYVTICMRARQFDDYTRHLLTGEPDSLVIHLGCGLDSRFDRVDNGKVEWYDLDFPEVIELRRHFYTEADRYHFISSPVMALDWLDRVERKDRAVIILAEGLLMYLKGTKVEALFLAFQEKFPISTIIFDTYSKMTVRGIKNHPSIKKTGAVVRWGIDHAEDVESWSNKIHFKEEWYFTQSREIHHLNLGYRILFKVMGLLPVARKAHRIFVFEIGEGDRIKSTA